MMKKNGGKFDCQFKIVAARSSLDFGDSDSDSDSDWIPTKVGKKGTSLPPITPDVISAIKQKEMVTLLSKLTSIFRTSSNNINRECQCLEGRIDGQSFYGFVRGDVKLFRSNFETTYRVDWLKWLLKILYYCCTKKELFFHDSRIHAILDALDNKLVQLSASSEGNDKLIFERAHKVLGDRRAELTRTQKFAGKPGVSPRKRRRTETPLTKKRKRSSATSVAAAKSDRKKSRRREIPVSQIKARIRGYKLEKLQTKLSKYPDRGTLFGSGVLDFVDNVYKIIFANEGVIPGIGYSIRVLLVRKLVELIESVPESERNRSWNIHYHLGRALYSGVTAQMREVAISIIESKESPIQEKIFYWFYIYASLRQRGEKTIEIGGRPVTKAQCWENFMGEKRPSPASTAAAAEPIAAPSNDVLQDELREKSEGLSAISITSSWRLTDATIIDKVCENIKKSPDLITIHLEVKEVKEVKELKKRPSSFGINGLQALVEALRKLESLSTVFFATTTEIDEADKELLSSLWSNLLSFRSLKVCSVITASDRFEFKR